VEIIFCIYCYNETGEKGSSSYAIDANLYLYERRVPQAWSEHLEYPVWVPGLKIDPLRLLAGCRKRRLNQAPLNPRGLIWLLMMDWSERGNIRKRGPLWNPSVRTQLFAADRRTSHGSKKEETFRCPTEALEETRKSECCPTGRRRTGSLRRPQWRIVHWDWCWHWG